MSDYAFRLSVPLGKSDLRDNPFPFVFFPLSVIAFFFPCGIVEGDDYKKGEDDGSRLFVA